MKEEILDKIKKYLISFALISILLMQLITVNGISRGISQQIDIKSSFQANVVFAGIETEIYRDESGFLGATYKRWDLWLLNLSTGLKTRLTDTPDEREEKPCWAPSGNKIAYTSEKDMNGSVEYSIYVLEIKTLKVDKIFSRIIRFPEAYSTFLFICGWLNDNELLINFNGTLYGVSMGGDSYFLVNSKGVGGEWIINALVPKTHTKIFFTGFCKENSSIYLANLSDRKISEIRKIVTFSNLHYFVPITLMDLSPEEEKLLVGIPTWVDIWEDHLDFFYFTGYLSIIDLKEFKPIRQIELYPLVFLMGWSSACFLSDNQIIFSALDIEKLRQTHMEGHTEADIDLWMYDISTKEMKKLTDTPNLWEVMPDVFFTPSLRNETMTKTVITTTVTQTTTISSVIKEATTMTPATPPPLTTPTTTEVTTPTKTPITITTPTTITPTTTAPAGFDVMTLGIIAVIVVVIIMVLYLVMRKRR